MVFGYKNENLKNQSKKIVTNKKKNRILIFAWKIYIDCSMIIKRFSDQTYISTACLDALKWWDYSWVWTIDKLVIKTLKTPGKQEQQSQGPQLTGENHLKVEKKNPGMRWKILLNLIFFTSNSAILWIKLFQYFSERIAFYQTMCLP